MQELYADVIIDITNAKLDRPFQYRVPNELAGEIEPGMMVEVPFGAGSRIIHGYVIRLTDTHVFPLEKMKEISAIVSYEAQDLGEQSKLISLAAWIRARYGCTMIQALKTVIPSGSKVKPKEKTILKLLLEPETAGERLAYYERKHQTARYRLLQAMLEEKELPRDLVTEKLNITAPVIRALQEQGVIEVCREKSWRMPQMDMGTAGERFRLTDAQQAAVNEVTGSWGSSAGTGKYLLHGVTGSGKTAVYMELIAYALSQGQQAIVLIPEIALTYQTVMRFYRRFGDRVSRIHSKLSAGERQDQFERARRGEVQVMIGPRSALFTPFPKLGLIVIDEEHEGAYRSEQTPRYDAVETAFQRAKIEGARVVLGSATPSLESYYAAMNGAVKLLKLPDRAGGALLPDVEIIDMRSELREGNGSLLSRRLQDSIRESLSRGEQTMLFLNRRGLAGTLSCRSCGKSIRCPHCDVSLSLHEGGRMICHYCGYETHAVRICPSCGSGTLRPFRAGTQQVEQEVSRLFPSARIMRMDQDTTRGREDYTKILSAFSGREADILIGTQMIVKGHDFPYVTVMGVLAADISLHSTDYRAAERTFQLLTQAVGRAGRAARKGTALIQTYEPEHYAVRFAADQNYEAFYGEEVSYRQAGLYPPAGAMTAIHLSSPDEQHLMMAADYLGKYIRMVVQKYHAAVLGPADETIAKIADHYRKVLYVKAGDARTMELIRERIERYIAVNDGYKSVEIQYDVE